MARKGKYYWGSLTDPPPIDAHSLAKHTVLRRYLQQYLDVVTSNRRMEVLNLTLVDAFAGGGRYRDPQTGSFCPGSPIIMLHAVADAIGNLVASGRRLNIRTRFFFNDSERAAIEMLRDVLIDEGYGSRIEAGEITLLQSPFEEVLPGILRDIKTRQRAGRTIFLMDQYGYSAVPLRGIRSIFETLPKAEVVLTLFVDWLIGFLTNAPTHEAALRPLEVTPAELMRFKHDLNWQAQIQHYLYRHIVDNVGAPYYTPFFVQSPEANKSHWLLHFACHSRARYEMMKVHWGVKNHFRHYGRAGLREMLGYDPRLDEERSGQPFMFDGRAEERVKETILADLPQIVFGSREGISFAQLLDTVANETPATRGMLKQAVETLAREGDIELVGAAGRSAQRVEGNIIRPRRQLRLFGRSGGSGHR